MKATTADTQSLITAFTGLSTEQQAQASFESAYVWLDQVLQTDPYGLEMLPLQPGFWPWWTKHWGLIDAGFLESVRVDPSGMISYRKPGEETWFLARSEQHMAVIWQEFHNPRYVRGNRALLERSFHQYIKELVSRH